MTRSRYTQRAPRAAALCGLITAGALLVGCRNSGVGRFELRNEAAITLDVWLVRQGAVSPLGVAPSRDIYRLRLHPGDVWFNTSVEARDDRVARTIYTPNVLVRVCRAGAMPWYDFALDVFHAERLRLCFREGEEGSVVLVATDEAGKAVETRPTTRFAVEGW